MIPKRCHSKSLMMAAMQMAITDVNSEYFRSEPKASDQCTGIGNRMHKKSGKRKRKPDGAPNLSKKKRKLLNLKNNGRK